MPPEIFGAARQTLFRREKKLPNDQAASASSVSFVATVMRASTSGQGWRLRQTYGGEMFGMARSAASASTIRPTCAVKKR